MGLFHRLAVALFLLLSSGAAVAGVVAGATRLIVHERDGQKEVHLKATGSSTYLVIARVVDARAREAGANDVKAEGFSVLPPAFLLKGGQERQLQIIAASPHRLPRDRESLLYFVVSAVPEGSKEKNTVQIAVRTWIKLFYRPSSLEGRRVPEPEVRRDGDSVVMKNDSPFYVSLSGVYVQGKPVTSPGDIAPYGEKRLNGCHVAESCEVRWIQRTSDNRQVQHSLTLGR